jgi:hypothetical protein
MSPVFSLLVPLFMFLTLRPLSILLFPLLPHFMPLFIRERLIFLYIPGPFPFPTLVSLPVLPILLKSLMGDPFIVPTVPAPVMVSVVSSPTRVYIKIKSWDISVISPAPVIIM